MNWMGGARNRVKFQGEKRIQQEFFERQKLAAAQSFSSKLSSKKRKGLSQDLVVLHTLSRVHSAIPDVAKKRRPIQKLDLEKFKSCTRQIDDVDMGPCSPSETPSKLLLNDGKLDRDSGRMKLTDQDVVPSRELFPKRSHFHKYNNTINTQLDTQSVMKSSNTPMFCVENKIRTTEISREVQNTNCTSKPSNEFIFSKPKQDVFTTSSTVKGGMFDPYVSEDFQVTPLVKYTKRRSPMDIDFDKSKKKRHTSKASAKYKILDEIANKKYSQHKDSHFSSTPITFAKSTKSNKSIANEQFGGLSPIDKGEVFSKDVDYGFRFKPRPMILTPVKKNAEKSGVSHHLSQEKKMKDPLMQTISFHSSVPSFKKTETSQCDIIKRCDEYEQDFEGMNRYPQNNLNTSEESCRDIYENDSASFVSVCLSRDHLQGSQISSGSFGKYRNIFRHKNELESPLLIKNSTVPLIKQGDVKESIEDPIIIEAGMSKPKFADIEEEFHYKPLKSMKSGSMKIASGIMNMYENCGNDTEQEYDSGNMQSDSLEDTKITCTERKHSGSVLSIASPLPGDEFPKHLLSPSVQLQEEIDRQLTQIVSDENKGDLNQYSSHDNGFGSYKPLKPQMDDVLCEMKQLEDQNSVTPNAVLQVDEDEKYISEKSRGDVFTESFEADAYLQSDNILLETIKEHMKETKTAPNKETTSEEKKESNVMDTEEKNDQVNDKIEKPDQNNIQLDNHSFDAQVIESDIECIPVDANVAECDIAKYSDGDIDHGIQYSSASQYKDVKCHSQDLDTKESNETACNVSKDNGKNGVANKEENIVDYKIDGYKNEVIKESENNFDTSDKIQVFRNSKENFNTVSTENDKDLNVSDNAEKVVTVLDQLQVQEISSGKNQSTQTYTESEVYKSFVEVSTSPFKELESLKVMSDVAVQCDLPVVESLSNLAGKCYKVTPCRISEPASLRVKEEKKENVNQT